MVEKKRRKQVLSDSEDDEPVKKVVHKKTEEKTMENHKSVSASDIFGKGPIKREAATKVVKKPKEPKEVKKNDKHANKIKSVRINQNFPFSFPEFLLIFNLK